VSSVRGFQHTVGQPESGICPPHFAPAFKMPNFTQTLGLMTMWKGTTISDKESFISWLELNDLTEVRNYYDRQYYRTADELLCIADLHLKNTNIRDRHFESTEFKNTVFEECDFTGAFIVACELENVEFRACKFTWSKFIDVDLKNVTFTNCIISGLELADADIENSEFLNCSEILDLNIRSTRNSRQLKFTNSYLHFMDIEPIKKAKDDSFYFDDCLIKESSFDRIDLTDSAFINCSLSLNQFTGCKLKSTTFKDENSVPSSEYNFIDIRTILSSEKLSLNKLESLFGINSPDVKEYLRDMTSEIEYQSIFISYSFKDKEFANAINTELVKRGIFTFLFEKDSPAGKTLRSIMNEGIKQKDRVLFIASRSSLRSIACQFELSEGRSKQEELWQEVLFPIHIDDYLFQVEFDQIRPVEKRDDYWKNIEELRATNSLSFKEFVKAENRNNMEFEKLIHKLIKGLRKN
jgi:uncharacterized protein YjbI with pentapeptide repeats